jgi:exodeoxyribonuclease VII small subunit
MANTKGSFEEQLAELQKVVERLEQGELSLDESVSLFERGALLSRACRGQISNAESRIQAVTDLDEDAPARVEDLAMAVEEGEDDEEEDDDDAYDDGRL